MVVVCLAEEVLERRLRKRSRPRVVTLDAPGPGLGLGVVITSLEDESNPEFLFLDGVKRLLRFLKNLERADVAGGAAAVVDSLRKRRRGERRKGKKRRNINNCGYIFQKWSH